MNPCILEILLFRRVPCVQKVSICVIEESDCLRLVGLHLELNMRCAKHDQEHESQYVSEQEDQRLYPSGEVLRVYHNDIHFFVWKLEA